MGSRVATDSWQFTGLTGALVFGRSLSGDGAFWFRLVDLVGTRGIIWEYELYEDGASSTPGHGRFDYYQDRTFWHTFPGDVSGPTFSPRQQTKATLGAGLHDRVCICGRRRSCRHVQEDFDALQTCRYARRPIPSAGAPLTCRRPGKVKKSKQADSPKAASQSTSRRKKAGIDKSMISSPSAFKVRSTLRSVARGWQPSITSSMSRTWDSTRKKASLLRTSIPPGSVSCQSSPVWASAR